MNLFFSKANLNRLMWRATNDVAEVKTSAVRDLLVEHDVEPHQYKEAFRQLITGLALGGGKFRPESVGQVEQELGDMAVRERSLQIFAAAIVKNILHAGYDHQFITMLATEILDLVADAVRIREALRG